MGAAFSTGFTTARERRRSAFVVSVATHYGLWKPTGVAGAAQDVVVTPRDPEKLLRRDLKGD